MQEHIYASDHRFIGFIPSDYQFLPTHPLAESCGGYLPPSIHQRLYTDITEFVCCLSREGRLDSLSDDNMWTIFVGTWPSYFITQLISMIHTLRLIQSITAELITMKDDPEAVVLRLSMIQQREALMSVFKVPITKHQANLSYMNTLLSHYCRAMYFIIQSQVTWFNPTDTDDPAVLTRCDSVPVLVARSIVHALRGGLINTHSAANLYQLLLESTCGVKIVTIGAVLDWSKTLWWNEESHLFYNYLEPLVWLSTRFDLSLASTKTLLRANIYVILLKWLLNPIDAESSPLSLTFPQSTSVSPTLLVQLILDCILCQGPSKLGDACLIDYLVSIWSYNYEQLDLSGVLKYWTDWYPFDHFPSFSVTADLFSALAIQAAMTNVASPVCCPGTIRVSCCPDHWKPAGLRDSQLIESVKCGSIDSNKPDEEWHLIGTLCKVVHTILERISKVIIVQHGYFTLPITTLPPMGNTLAARIATIIQQNRQLAHAMTHLLKLVNAPVIHNTIAKQGYWFIRSGLLRTINRTISKSSL